ncbi:hypothetical protein CKC_03605 [Candidatus Liberibacter solanacearum CLso-ZC1]|uniref:Uncharacterized protein n=1 Tax=Liberibacter solanacearum (strain CLso-ZC1) TaxID=658172 RepID=E4UBG4_LIBSC|nr:hypothetical protein CKC_03605 [Candidatus Liberibacter solanacearum CLso-ZC1]
MDSLHFILNQLPKESGEEKGLPREEVKKVSLSTPTASKHSCKGSKIGT